MMSRAAHIVMYGWAVKQAIDADVRYGMDNWVPLGLASLLDIYSTIEKAHFDVIIC